METWKVLKIMKWKYQLKRQNGLVKDPVPASLFFKFWFQNTTSDLFIYRDFRETGHQGLNLEIYITTPIWKV